MTVALICFFFLSLQISSIPAAVNQFTGSAGEDFSGHCGSSFSGTRKIFCRENCGNGNVLIETTENSAENGRYSIEYVKVHGPNIYSFSVKISALTESDSGRYRCGLGQSSESYQDFTLTVSGVDKMSTSSVSVSTPLTSTPTDSWSLSFSSGSFTPSVSSETTNQSTVSHEEEETSDETSAWFLLAVALTGAGILLSAALLVLCRRRCHRLLTGVKTTRGSNRRDQKDDDCGNSSSGDLIYMNAKPVCRNKK
ncbi:uncharacterized protein LOC114140987 isoform X1 [Xiphophorus couchianus]|uniref:uncharacterized protein LOC114140987 isoform X1 n=1 Tax=Xiphophorus couchianus TaxID=32473 RepID=UPI001015E13F|nr:uncharacterized protein LOC114140987 isoform X1 [Xiphophorus couchianus]